MPGEKILFAILGWLVLLTGPQLQAADAYSLYAGQHFPTSVYWGDTHLHTVNSLDARLMGVALDMEDAYRFARGEEVVATSGQVVRLSRPLDFLVITDHSDAMGVLHQLLSGNDELMQHGELRRLRKSFLAGGEEASRVSAVFLELIAGNYSGPLLDEKVMRSVWEEGAKTADRYNQPGRFTTLIGYEWTPMRGGDKLHRNVIYRGDADTARQLMPYTATESLNPQDLWKWMQRYQDLTGDSVLALAHNGNLSNGKMFPVVTNPETGTAIDAEYVKMRARWEPLLEVTQIKGDSETHPYLSPEDEFADFETWDRGNASMAARKTRDMLQYEYAREALKNGLKLERELGTNPYQFGMVGSTDSHTGLATAEEPNYFGKMSHQEPAAERILGPMTPPLPGVSDEEMWQNWETSSSGYAAVWATENSRAAIWDAMARKEVYATTGPRMTVRFFGGWNFSEDDASFQQLASAGYSKGVPMGGTLVNSRGEAPMFLVGAMKDPLSGHLDRIQIIKGWLDAGGATHEKVFDVAWGDAHIRQPGADGTLPAVGNTVNVADARWTNTIGDAELVGYWQDPEFDPTEPAVYYARVIEIPTPRWPVYDATFYKTQPQPGTKMIIQERAYTSPIWYKPHP